MNLESITLDLGGIDSKSYNKVNYEEALKDKRK